MIQFENGLYTIDGRKVENVDIPFLKVYDEATKKYNIYNFKKSKFNLEFATKFFNKYNQIREKIQKLEKKEEIDIIKLKKEIKELILMSSDIDKEIAENIQVFDLWAIANDFLGLINDNDYLQRKNLIIIMHKLKEKINEEEKKFIFEKMRENKELLYEILDYDILDKEKYDKTFETNLEDTALQLWGEYKKKIQKK